MALRGSNSLVVLYVFLFEFMDSIRKASFLSAALKSAFILGTAVLLMDDVDCGDEELDNCLISMLSDPSLFSTVDA